MIAHKLCKTPCYITMHWYVQKQSGRRCLMVGMPLITRTTQTWLTVGHALLFLIAHTNKHCTHTHPCTQSCLSSRVVEKYSRRKIHVYRIVFGVTLNGQISCIIVIWWSCSSSISTPAESPEHRGPQRAAWLEAGQWDAAAVWDRLTYDPCYGDCHAAHISTQLWPQTAQTLATASTQHPVWLVYKHLLFVRPGLLCLGLGIILYI